MSNSITVIVALYQSLDYEWMTITGKCEDYDKMTGYTRISERRPVDFQMLPESAGDIFKQHKIDVATDALAKAALTLETLTNER